MSSQGKARPLTEPLVRGKQVLLLQTKSFSAAFRVRFGWLHSLALPLAPF